jgi:hypothetical protein
MNLDHQVRDRRYRMHYAMSLQHVAIPMWSIHEPQPFQPYWNKYNNCLLPMMMMMMMPLSTLLLLLLPVLLPLESSCHVARS